MLLSNLNMIGQRNPKQVHIEKGKILAVADTEKILPTGTTESHIIFENVIVFPGLINSHDHLDFNLFPKLGKPLYKNYTEWGSDIHRSDKKIINSILKIPQDLRTRWGVYKNLLNGVTTVVNHGNKLKVKDDIIAVNQDSFSLHSVSGEKGWKSKLITPFKQNKPTVIHIGEGTDAFSSKEIDHLIRWNIFRKELIGVHGIAMNEKQASFFKALVWCPDSNLFLFGKTAAIDQLKNKVKILFGTDSTLTASWNLWEQLRIAKSQQMISDEDLFASLTSTAADIWQLANTGSIAENQYADIVIAKKKNNLYGWDAVYALNPEDILMVLQKGNIRLFDQELFNQLTNSGFALNDFYKIYIRGNGKYVQGNLPELMKDIRYYHPSINFPITDSRI